nr:caspase family protein [uncultured Rhodoferax sp.]
MKLAFLVGVSDYGGGSKNLPFCKADVEALAHVLQRKGFECTTWLDKPLPDILKSSGLPQLLKKATSPEDVVLFYFSGHGEDLGGEQLLLGKGGKMQNMQEALHTANLMPLSNILDSLAKLPGQKIAIVDACRVNSHDQTPGEDLRGLRSSTIQSLKNCAIVYASADGLASFGNQTNSISLFTQTLCEELREYGRGFFTTIGTTTNRLKNYDDEKIQTPWIYSSLQECVLDGFRICSSELSDIRAARCISSRSKDAVWAIIYGSNAIAKWEMGKFVETARMPPNLAVGVIALDNRPGHSEFAVVRQGKRTVARVRVTVAPKWDDSAVNVSSVASKDLIRIFGAEWSGCGARLVGFGQPDQGKYAVTIWAATKRDTLKSEPILGLPIQVECNAVLWLSDNCIVAAFCKDGSDNTTLYRLEHEGKIWRASSFIKLNGQKRVIAMTKAVNVPDRIYVGSDEGAIGFVDISHPVEPNFLPRQHPPTGLNYIGPVPWSGRSRGDELTQLGVISLFQEPESGLVGLTYFDGSAAFLDPVLETYVKSLVLKGRPRRPRMAQTASLEFLVAGGSGELLRIEKC